MKYSLLLLLAFLTMDASAAFRGSVSFSEREKERHAAGIKTIIDTASACLQSTYERHTSFYARNGISAFYGDQSSFAKLSDSGKRDLLRRLGKSASLLNEMEPISCVGLAIRCLKKGFASANQMDLWEKVMDFTRENDVDGTAMQTALRELGWKLYYWNPDTRQSASWDREEKSSHPGNPKGIWGYHEYRWNTVRNSNVYYNSEVDDYRLLVDFGRSPPAAFKRAPFFLGTAHAGYHVFPGYYDKVIEGHSTRSITDKQTVETSPFNPLQDGGGPRGQYFSGMMALPPGY